MTEFPRLPQGLGCRLPVQVTESWSGDPQHRPERADEEITEMDFLNANIPKRHFKQAVTNSPLIPSKYPHHMIAPSKPSRWSEVSQRTKNKIWRDFQRIAKGRRANQDHAMEHLLLGNRMAKPQQTNPTNPTIPNILVFIGGRCHWHTTPKHKAERPCALSEGAGLSLLHTSQRLGILASKAVHLY